MTRRVRIINLGNRKTTPLRRKFKYSRFKRKIYCPQVQTIVDKPIISNGHIGSKILIGMTYDTPIL